MTGVTVILRHQLRQPRDMPVGMYDFEVNLDDGSEGKFENDDTYINIICILYIY